jgi:hypothetical protein
MTQSPSFRVPSTWEFGTRQCPSRFLYLVSKPNHISQLTPIVLTISAQMLDRNDDSSIEGPRTSILYRVFLMGSENLFLLTQEITPLFRWSNDDDGVLGYFLVIAGTTKRVGNPSTLLLRAAEEFINSHVIRSTAFGLKPVRYNIKLAISATASRGKCS